MISIKQKLSIAAPVNKVYEAITSQEGLAGWWTTDTKARPEVGSIARFTFGSYVKEMKVTELKPLEYVKWTCLKAIDEWIGSEIIFQLHVQDGKTILHFHHDGWKAITETYAVCTYDWAQFLRSMKLYCETGKGRPYPLPFD